MAQQRNNSGSSINTVNTIIGIVLMVIALVVMFYIARFIYRLLWILSPLAIIAALVIDRNVVINFGKWIINLFKQNTIAGIVSVALTAIAFPLVSVFLLGRAFLSKKVKEMKEEQELRTKGEFIEFEELDSKPLELPELDKQEEPKKGNDYEELF